MCSSYYWIPGLHKTLSRSQMLEIEAVLGPAKKADQKWAEPKRYLSRSIKIIFCAKTARFLCAAISIIRQSTFLDHRSALPRCLLQQQGCEESLYPRP